MTTTAHRRLARIEAAQAQQRRQGVDAWIHALTDPDSLQRLFAQYQTDPRFADDPDALTRLFLPENRSALFHDLHAVLYPENKP